TWISNGIHGQIFALLVKTDPAAEPRHRGMSLFLAEKGPGFTVSKKLEKLGYKGIDSAELVFADYQVPADRLIGGAEGRGLQQALGGHRQRRSEAHPRGPRPFEGVHGRAAVPRRAAAGERRGHQRIAAHHHRPPADRPEQGVMVPNAKTPSPQASPRPLPNPPPRAGREGWGQSGARDRAAHVPRPAPAGRGRGPSRRQWAAEGP